MVYKHDYDKALTILRVILQCLNDGESLGVKKLAYRHKDIIHIYYTFTVNQKGKLWQTIYKKQNKL